MCLDVVNFDGLTVGNSGGTSTEGTGTPEAAASEAQLVPEKTKKYLWLSILTPTGIKGGI